MDEQMQALREALGAILNWPAQVPAVARFARWVSRLAGIYQHLPPNRDGMILMEIKDGEVVSISEFKLGRQQRGKGD